MSGPIRRAAVAGTWYPGDPESIAAEVEGYLARVPAERPSGKLVGLISPHAGLRYSGPVAAHGYALLRAFAITQDEQWLARARRFAMHALEQVERMRKHYGRGRFTLFTGDVGAALFARACSDVDARFPLLARL